VDAGTRLRHRVPELRKGNPETCSLAKLSNKDPKNESGARLGVIVEDGGVGEALISLGLA
jgi:hypothetical protein